MDITFSAVRHDKLYFDLQIIFEWLELLEMFELDSVDLRTEVLTSAIDCLVDCAILTPFYVVVIYARRVAELEYQMIRSPDDWWER